MSDTNRVGLRYAKTSQTVFPVNPAPTLLHQLRYTGTPSLAFAPQTVQSAEIRSDRQVTDLALIGGQAGGDVDFELSAQAFDPFLASVVFSSWTDPPAVEGTAAISTVAVVSNKTVVTTAAANDFLAGHIVKLTGPPNLGNGAFAVESKSGNALTLVPVDGVQMTGTFTVTASTRLAVVGFQAGSAGALDIEVSGGSLTVVAGSSTFNNLMGSAANLVPGQWIKIAGAAGSTNNVWMRLTSVTNRRLTGDAPTGAVAESVVGRLSVYFGGYVRNPASPEAIANHTYLIERRFEDHSPVEREVFVGMVLDQFQLTLEQAAIATGKLIWFGNSAEIDETVTNLFSATPTDREAPAGSVLNSANNVARLGLGADQIDQGRRERRSVGQSDPCQQPETTGGGSSFRIGWKRARCHLGNRSDHDLFRQPGSPEPAFEESGNLTRLRVHQWGKGSSADRSAPDQICQRGSRGCGSESGRDPSAHLSGPARCDARLHHSFPTERICRLIRIKRLSWKPTRSNLESGSISLTRTGARFVGSNADRPTPS